ncbi:dimethyladenosine transferase 2, mitochondrial [Cherax quadricarinatus]
MMALRRISQQGLLTNRLFYCVHREQWAQSSFRGIEQMTKVTSSMRSKQYSLNSVLYDSKIYNNENIAENNKSELSVHPEVPSIKLETNNIKCKINDKYDNENGKDLFKILRSHLKNVTSGKRQYIMDFDVAEKLVRHLSKDLEKEDVIVECSPGLGVLTRKLLTQTNHNIIAYEPHESLRSSLVDVLGLQYPSRLHIYDLDVQKFYSYYISERRDPGRKLLHKLLYPMCLHGNSGISPVKIVGVIFDMKFFARLVLSFVFQCCFYEDIFPIFYLYIPNRIFDRIVVGSKNFSYHYLSIPFQIYFHLEHLDVASRSGFYPPLRAHGRNTRMAPGSNNMYLIKISPRKELWEMISKDELEKFEFFMNTVSRIKRNDTLLMCLERWIPDCGPQLIKNGLNIFNHPKNLTLEQLLLAYKIFTNLPLYEESPFHNQCIQFAARLGEKDTEVSEHQTVTAANDEKDKLLDS